jgi:hypothetical protein
LIHDFDNHLIEVGNCFKGIKNAAAGDVWMEEETTTVQPLLGGKGYIIITRSANKGSALFPEMHK